MTGSEALEKHGRYCDLIRSGPMRISPDVPPLTIFRSHITVEFGTLHL
jgi:hypothetical protein